MARLTFRVESNNRWDALVLAGKLTRYRWYLIEPDARRWDVCVAVEQTNEELPGELVQTIKGWLRERHLATTIVHTDTEDHVIAL